MALPAVGKMKDAAYKTNMGLEEKSLPCGNAKWNFFSLHAAWRRSCGLDDLPPGVQQDGIGVRFGPEDAIAVVEVIGERLRDLEGAAVAVAVVLVPLWF